MATDESVARCNGGSVLCEKRHKARKDTTQRNVRYTYYIVCYVKWGDVKGMSAGPLGWLYRKNI